MFMSYHRKIALAATITVSVPAVSVLGIAGADTGAAVAGDAQLRLLVADDYIDARLLLPANLIPESLHGADPEKGGAAQPPYVTLLQQADGFIMFPVESRCHSDGASASHGERIRTAFRSRTLPRHHPRRRPAQRCREAINSTAMR